MRRHHHGAGAAIGCGIALLAAVAVGGAAAQRLGSPAADSLAAQFYQARGWRLAWVNGGAATPAARELAAALAAAGRDGLDPRDYDDVGAALDSLAAAPLSILSAWHLDSLLTHGFFAYARDLAGGRVDPARVHALWAAVPQRADYAAVLEAALRAPSGGVTVALRGFAPPQPGYGELRSALERYRAIARRGDWPDALGARLAAEGYDTAFGADAALRRFQELHGLDTDGVEGPQTEAALRVPAAERARQIALNLERWRWLPRALGARYVVVNSAAYMLEVMDDGTPRLAMRAVVGRPERPTPIASSRVTDVLFRPVWNIPRSITVDEILPIVRRNPRYLAREGIRVFAGGDGREIDPATIDWRAVTETTFPYQLRQEPNAANPLGGVKLVFWTPFDVFIHDTPARPLFSERLRAFSHGCVRVEGAADLAAYLLPDWSPDSIRAAMGRQGARERWVHLAAPVPVYLVYRTAWVEPDGLVAFREDAYGWDALLARAIERPPAAPVPAAGECAQ